jgi:mannosyltransferase
VLFTLAPIALLAAAGVYRYRGRTLVLLVVAAVLAWPSQQTVRSAAEHQGPNVRYLTSLIVKEQTGGDGIIYTGANAWSMRVGVDYYLAGRSGPRDLLLQRPAAELGELADQQCSDAAACIGQTPRIWLVVQNPAGKPTPAQLILDRDYRKVQTWTVSKGSLTLYERG